jgi:hypothetical protein
MTGFDLAAPSFENIFHIVRFFRFCLNTATNYDILLRTDLQDFLEGDMLW